MILWNVLQVCMRFLVAVKYEEQNMEVDVAVE